MRRRALALVAGTAIAAILSGSARAYGPRPSIVSLLDRYAAHDVDAPLALVDVDNKGAGAIVNELEQKGAAWTTARGPRDTAGRRLIAATFALDLTRAWTERFYRRSEGQRLLVWGRRSGRR